MLVQLEIVSSRALYTGSSEQPSPNWAKCCSRNHQDLPVCARAAALCCNLLSPSHPLLWYQAETAPPVLLERAPGCPVRALSGMASLNFTRPSLAAETQPKPPEISGANLTLQVLAAKAQCNTRLLSLGLRDMEGHMVSHQLPLLLCQLLKSHRIRNTCGCSPRELTLGGELVWGCGHTQDDGSSL